MQSFLCIFFFSSRRRHTRSDRDWSSDVCSSDLTNRYTATSVASEGRMTQPKRFQFTSTDGLSIAWMKWGGHHDVRGVIQIAHGLGEHMGRYAELAETLVEGEFVVYGNDQIGRAS